MRKTLAVLLLGVVLFPVLLHANSMTEEEAVGRYNEGVKAQKQQDYIKARTSYQKTMAMLQQARRPDIVKSVYNNMGVMYAQAGNFQAAQAAFEAALSLDPDYPEANFNMGILYTRLQDAEKAVSYLLKVFRTAGEFVIQGQKEQ